MKFPKPVTYKNKDYLAYIRKQPCAICGSPAEPHHVRRERWGAGTGKKPHDYVTVPLCRYHHDPAVEEDILPETSIRRQGVREGGFDIGHIRHSQYINDYYSHMHYRSFNLSLIFCYFNF